jgi:transcription elongation factor GreA
MDKVPITRSGLKALRDKLKYLRQVVRPRVLDELQEARSFGVKTDNQQYLIARERHLVLQKQIQDLSEQISRCEIFAGRKFRVKQVAFGTLITIRNLDTGETLAVQMVGPFESDAGNGRLSIHSPVGRCLMGCFEGDHVLVAAPAGARKYQVVTIDC